MMLGAKAPNCDTYEVLITMNIRSHSKGAVKALKNKGIFLTGKKVVILGAGGAARAISVECALAGAGFVTIINRTKERAKELASVLKHHTGTDSVGLA